MASAGTRIGTRGATPRRLALPKSPSRDADEPISALLVPEHQRKPN